MKDNTLYNEVVAHRQTLGCKLILKRVVLYVKCPDADLGKGQNNQNQQIHVENCLVINKSAS